MIPYFILFLENFSHGYCQWKDSQQPTEILAKLCEKYGLEQPVYNILENKITIGNESFFANTEIRNETGRLEIILALNFMLLTSSVKLIVTT